MRFPNGMPPSPPARDLPLCVDLDGTLIAGDLLWEAFRRGVRARPLLAFSCLGWLLLRGRAHLKARLAGRVEIDYARLPYNAPLLEFLRGEKARGRRVVLATASHGTFAHGVAAHLGLFDAVFASSATCNLKGRAKRAVLGSAFAATGYAYIGNSRDDLPVWEGAAARYAANAAPGVLRRLRKLGPVERVFFQALT